MRLLIHDLTDKELEKLLPKLDNNIKILPNTKKSTNVLVVLAAGLKRLLNVL